MDLSVVIVSWNTRELVVDCTSRLLAELDEAHARWGLTWEVIVVDNGSDDGTIAALAERFPRVSLLPLPTNRGFAAGNNAAFRRAKGREVLLFNSDAQISARAIRRCLEVLEAHPDVGAVGPRLVFPDGREQSSAHDFPSLLSEWVPRFLRFSHSTRWVQAAPEEGLRTVPALRAAVFFVRREVIDTVGPLCEDYFFFLEDTDWCWRIGRARWRILEVRDATAVHGLGQSSKRKEPLRTRIEYHRSLYRFVALWRGPWVLRGVQAIRILRALGTALLALPAIGFSRRARERFSSRSGLLRWHFRGQPAEAGLVGFSAVRPRLDWSPQKREAPDAGHGVKGGGQ